MIQAKDLFDLNHTIAKTLFEQKQFPWEILEALDRFIISIGPTLQHNNFQEIAPSVWCHYKTIIAPTASILGPCIIGEGCEIRHGAFIRENVIIGSNAIIGNSTEIKNSILFDRVQVPHFNYIGDSILGYASHLGAGAILSNVKSDQSFITLKLPDPYPSNRRKLGALLGDHVEIGCHCVIYPGTIIGRNTTIYPLNSIRGYLKENLLYKDINHIVPKTNLKDPRLV